MSVIVFIEVADKEIRGSSLEAVGYGAELAKMTNSTAVALVLGNEASAEQIAKIGNYGISKVLHAQDSRLDVGNIQAYSNAIVQALDKENANTLIYAKSSLGDAIAARVAAEKKASFGTNIVELPNLSNGFVVKKAVFTGKAFQYIALNRENKILAIKKGAFAVQMTDDKANVESFSPNLSDKDFAVKITKTDKVTGELLLPEADLVVSGGRGLKGPENWGVILDLAKALNAATGCSKPVSDLDWRPHHEHVGQTGVKVSPNLYIAVGISGAIQHLAGVSSSKCIVVINKDAEAPFFKAADYGIVGDAFEILPKLTKALQA
ncbi:MAG: electron transfer flavoprotein subunit alpha/FixB family protein [Bacteroidetes bacterium]|nr:MAG: electron transfer flavoprotein subunit alpha/FixB family protein [Bacteroidota bacterium]